MALTPEQRRQRARLAALTRWAKEDPRANAERGQQGLRDRFRREIELGAGERLDPAELERRVDCALRAHMTRLALRASKARRAAA